MTDYPIACVVSNRVKRIRTGHAAYIRETILECVVYMVMKGFSASHRTVIYKTVIMLATNKQTL